MAITADYYVDPATGDDTNAGTSTAAPFATFQKAADTAVAGEIVALKANGSTADETLTAGIDFDTNEGNSSNIIHYIGVNSDWEEDGTQYIIDGNSSVASLFLNNSMDFIWFHNFILQNATGSALGGASAGYGIIFNNCVFKDNGGGTDFAKFGKSACIKCGFFNNGGIGADGSYYSTDFFFCTFAGNSSHGVYLNPNSSYKSICHGCLSYDNGGYGIYARYGYMGITNNTVHGNAGDGIDYEGNLGVFLGNRITNNTGYGIKSKFGTYANFPIGWNFIKDNTVAALQHSNLYAIKDSTGSDTNKYTGTTGYTSTTEGSEDFSLTSDATLRRTAIQMPEA